MAEMIHFIRQMEAYCQLEVIECSWKILVDFVQKKEGDLDALIQAHRQFLDRMVKKVLLLSTKSGREENILNQVREAFTVILQFREATVSPPFRPRRGIYNANLRRTTSIITPYRSLRAETQNWMKLGYAAQESMSAALLISFVDGDRVFTPAFIVAHSIRQVTCLIFSAAFESIAPLSQTRPKLLSMLCRPILISTVGSWESDCLSPISTRRRRILHIRNRNVIGISSYAVLA